MSVYLTKNPTETKKIGENLAKNLLKRKPQKRGFVLGLEGDLGGGKTTFLQGFARGLGIKEKILSPTFVIMRRFKLPNCPIGQLSNFYHIDCYRIQKTREILDLGFKEIIKNPGNIIAIEWAERIKKILPKNAIWLTFELKNKKSRRIVVKFKNGF